MLSLSVLTLMGLTSNWTLLMKFRAYLSRLRKEYRSSSQSLYRLILCLDIHLPSRSFSGEVNSHLCLWILNASSVPLTPVTKCVNKADLVHRPNNVVGLNMTHRTYNYTRSQSLAPQELHEFEDQIHRTRTTHLPTLAIECLSPPLQRVYGSPREVLASKF